MIEAITRALAGNGKASLARLAAGPGSPPSRGWRGRHSGDDGGEGAEGAIARRHLASARNRRAKPPRKPARHGGISPMLLKCRNRPIVTFCSMTPV